MKFGLLLFLLGFFIALWIIIVTVMFCQDNSNCSCESFSKKKTIVENFTIFGERCSGTNFLEHAMDKNFDLELTWKYGWKHEFGDHIDFSDSDSTLFLCIYRDPDDWINSLYRKKYHVPREINTIEDFLTKPMKMMKGKNLHEEIPNTRNIYTGNVYKNIFELRTVKLHYMLYDMPQKAKHVEIFSYENFCSNYDKIIKYLKDKYNLKIKSNQFPEAIRDIYRGGSIVKTDLEYEKPIPASRVHPYLNKHVEKKAGYNIRFKYPAQ